MQLWPEHVLALVNSAAIITGFIGAALVLIAIGVIYFTGGEIAKRTAAKTPSAAADQAKRLRQTEKELAAARKLEKEKAARLAQAEAALQKIRQSEEAKAERLSKAETDLTATQKSEKEKTARLSRLEADLAGIRAGAETQSQRMSQLETDLAASQKSEKEKTTRLSQTEADLINIRRSEETKAARLTQLEADLGAAQKSEKEKNQRLSQTESELAGARQSEEAKSLRVAQIEAELLLARREGQTTASRLAQIEAELAEARHAADEAKTVARKLEEKQPRSRTLTPDQRKQFLNAVRTLPKGKVVVSAIFFNKETHDAGSEILKLLREAGFTVVKSEPLDFFTTSRPESGIRIGFKNETDEPAHAVSIQNGFRAIGLDPPTTTLVNAEADDVVEIQVTPKE